MIGALTRRRTGSMGVDASFAVAALVLSAVMLAASGDSAANPAPRTAPTPSDPPAAEAFDVQDETAMDPASNPMLPGCNLGIGVCVNVPARPPMDPASNPDLPGCNLGIGVCSNGRST